MIVNFWNLSRTAVALLLTSTWLTGCVHHMVGAAVGGFRVGEGVVSAYSRPNVDAKVLPFCVYSADPVAASEDLAQVYVRTKVEIALKQQGFRIADAESRCQQAVFVGFGYGRPPERLQPSVLARITGTTTEERATAEPQPEPPGDTIRSRWLALWAVDRTKYLSNGETLELWRTVATTPESKAVRRRDLQGTATFLIAGASEYFGAGNITGQAFRVRTRDDAWDALSDEASD